MKAKVIFFALFLWTIADPFSAQIKFLVEDFEGFSNGNSDLKPNGIFTYGNIAAEIKFKDAVKQNYNGERFLQLTQKGKDNFGGWGKGIGLNVELDPSADFINFYVFQPASNDTNSIKIELQEDDDGNGMFDTYKDDSWIFSRHLENKNSWELISIPLSKFTDSNYGGDGVFNVNYRQGKLFCFIVSFPDAGHLKKEQSWCFDFICFSKGILPTGATPLDPPFSPGENFCTLGAWSKEGNNANFLEIASNFEKNFNGNGNTNEKKLGVVHFFQPFSVDGGTTQNFYPSPERINKVIAEGYIPLVTLENHFTNSNSTLKQPNLYSIVEGYYDKFFADWAKQIKLVNGTVMLRILHEFNGDWYPWCVANNDKNPKLLVSAFQRIHTIFKEQKVTNVKFIWCPNSMSLPQENWNFIMDAYPGDDYVDFVALDIYNGAGKAALWRSFRKEGIENYFMLTQRLPQKPLLVCETASRERRGVEAKDAQTKGEWIEQMSAALKSDMSKIKLLTWFNEKETFKITSSAEAKNAYFNYIWKDAYFKPGTGSIYPLLKVKGVVKK